MSLGRPEPATRRERVTARIPDTDGCGASPLSGHRRTMRRASDQSRGNRSLPHSTMHPRKATLSRLAPAGVTLVPVVCTNPSDRLPANAWIASSSISRQLLRSRITNAGSSARCLSPASVMDIPLIVRWATDRLLRASDAKAASVTLVPLKSRIRKADKPLRFATPASLMPVSASCECHRTAGACEGRSNGSPVTLASSQTDKGHV